MFDRKRFTYSLAGALLTGEWNAVALRSALRRAAMDRPFPVPALAGRIVKAFAARPEFTGLAAFLQSDAGLRRALARGFPVRRAAFQAAQPGIPAMQEPPLGLRGIAIPKMTTEASLAEWFGISLPHLQWHADITGRNRRHSPGPMRTYRYRWIQRKKGLPRLLEIPKATLKQMQRKILAEILDLLPTHPAAHGFCPGRSIITNAALHCGKEIVLRFDLADFFPSVSSARIFRIFRTLGYPAHVAQLLMGLCTTQIPATVWEARPGARDGADFFARQRLITRHLPQGAPTSPALANHAAARLDRRLSAFAAVTHATYTRYADDLTFSGNADLARSRQKMEAMVAVIAKEEGFALNHRKTRIMRCGVRQEVAGVVVNVRPNIRRADFDRLKAILTNCARHGPASQNRTGIPEFRAHLAGKVAHVASIHAAHGAKLRTIFDRITWEK